MVYSVIAAADELSSSPNPAIEWHT